MFDLSRTPERFPTQPDPGLAGDCAVMEVMADIDELYRAEFPRLVRALAVAYDTETAADAVQEAFLEADRRWRRVSRYADPTAWVRRVALNRASNARRNQRRRREILAGIREVPPDDMAASLLDLRAALAELPERMRLTVCLHYLGGLPVADIADALHVAEGTVKSNLHDGRERLRSLLTEDHHE